MKTVGEAFEKGALGENGGLGMVFARLDLDGRGGVLEAEEERSSIFEVC